LTLAGYGRSLGSNRSFIFSFSNRNQWWLFWVRSVRWLVLFSAVNPCVHGSAEGCRKADRRGRWKQARASAEARLREAPAYALAEKAVAPDNHTANYHSQLGEVLEVMAQHAGAVQ
jgi:hypothetical protein